MLKFEFVQPGEFANPFYEIFSNKKITGTLTYMNGQWGLEWNCYWYNAKDMMQISFKAAELNRATKQQRIFAWEKLI